MRLFKQRKPKFASITSLAEVKSYIREFVFDTQINDGPEIAEMFGCPPISDEVLEKEEEASEERLEAVGHLIPLMYNYASLFAEAVSSRMSASEALADTTLTPEMRASLKHITKATRLMLEEAIGQALVGSVSQMVSLELLKINVKKKGVK